MKFSCEKQDLSSAVQTASRAAAAKSAVMSLEAFVINARIFGEIIRKLPDDIVNISVSDNYTVEIKCGMSEFTIMGMNAADYPDLPTVDYQSTIEIAEKNLKSLISETNFAVSNNEARPIHTGALFELENGVVTVVAVDGYRLALRREKVILAELENATFVVPGQALAEVERITSDTDEAARITVGTKHIMFNIGKNQLISRKLEGEFLNYKTAVPASAKYSIDADRRELIETIDRVSLIISDKFKSPVRCKFTDGVLRVTTATTLGKAQDECAVSGDGEGLEIGFNNRYILDALKAAPADKVRLRLSTGIAPCVIVPADDSRNFLYMILPVRMRTNEN